MGTKVRTLYQEAGVECPKEKGEMDESEPCSKCGNYVKCMAALNRVFWGE